LTLQQVRGRMMAGILEVEECRYQADLQ